MINCYGRYSCPEKGKTMKVLIQKDYDNMSEWAARHIIDAINSHKEARPYVLGLPTGSSPIGVYQRLVAANKRGEVSFRNVVTFNMDEYVGLPRTHHESYWYFMHDNLFDHIDIPKENINILNGLRSLTEDTRIVNARFFGGDPEQVPKQALSVGVATVTDAREVLLLISGHNKARALAHCVEGGVSQQWTISALQMHENAVIVCDEAACGELKVDSYRYFKDVYRDEIL